VRNLIQLLLFLPLVVCAVSQNAEHFSSELSKATTRALLENISGLPPPIGGPIPEAEYLNLREPLTLYLTRARKFQGTLSNIQSDRIYLRIVQEGGEVVLSFPFEEVRGILFPGESIVASTVEKVKEGDLSEALPYLESIIGARYALFPHLPPEDLSLFRALPLAALAVDNPAQSIAYVKAIRPYLSLPADQDELDDIELLAYYRIQLREEAQERAQGWIAKARRYGGSALGYFILSALQFEQGEYDRSLYTSLNPIVFSGAIPEAYLGQCYSIAIASAHLLDDPIERDKLIDEMQERDLSWQPLRVFNSARDGLSDLTITLSDGPSLPIFLEEDAEENLIKPPSADPESKKYLDPSGLVPL
jgi:tetratricopeptide (TPR) repeat protein